ncbi:MAG TPA: outer membrane lipoprotein-sorting protein [Bacteroides sp.]|nr:outer membrane lipoprotein-sorting protein [Bacteroides sp.]
MKKNIFALFIMAVIAIGSLPAQDLDEILKTYFETIGQEKLLEANTISSTGKMMQMGMEMPFKMTFKRPKKLHLEVDVQGTKMVQGYDGENGWMIAPWTGSAEPIDIAGIELQQLDENADMDGKLWNYKEKGSEMELVGTEDMEGSDVFVLKLTTKDGNVDTYYLDSENYVILKSISKIFMQGSEVEVESFMSNFQEVDGYVMPFTTEQKFGGQGGMTMNIETVEYNIKVDDSIFAKPAVPAAVEE